jgi:hypothetical protein
MVETWNQRHNPPKHETGSLIFEILGPSALCCELLGFSCFRRSKTLQCIHVTHPMVLYDLRLQTLPLFSILET